MILAVNNIVSKHQREGKKEVIWNSLCIYFSLPEADKKGGGNIFVNVFIRSRRQNLSSCQLCALPCKQPASLRWRHTHQRKAKLLVGRRNKIDLLNIMKQFLGYAQLSQQRCFQYLQLKKGHCVYYAQLHVKRISGIFTFISHVNSLVGIVIFG